jgi:mRNA-degrading endonuclease toxin of MazEF toxin-antitoxin module
VVSEPGRGEIWWGEAPDTKGRPYLVLTRDQAIPVLRTIFVVGR